MINLLKLKKGLIELEYFGEDDIQGCSIEEIKKLEKFNNLKLPQAYKAFLKVFGKKIQGLSRLNDLNITYEEIFHKSDELKEFFCGLNTALHAGFIKSQSRLIELKIPDKIFVIMSTYSSCFHVIFCNSDKEDPPVYQFSGDVCDDKEFFLRNNFEKIYESVSDWISEFVFKTTS